MPKNTGGGTKKGGLSKNNPKPTTKKTPVKKGGKGGK